MLNSRISTGAFSLALTISVLLGGCSNTGMIRINDYSPLTDPSLATTNNPEIAKILEVKAQLPEKFKMAIYFKTRGHHHERNLRWEVDLLDPKAWSATDRETIHSGAESWVEQGAASGVFVISDALVESTQMEDLRKISAKMGADALMIVDGTYGSKETLNKKAWLYPLVVPTVFVHGNTVTTSYLAHVTVWDVRNEFLYATFEEQATATLESPMLFTSAEDKTLEQARALTAEKIKETLSDVSFSSQFTSNP